MAAVRRLHVQVVLPPSVTTELRRAYTPATAAWMIPVPEEATIEELAGRITESYRRRYPEFAQREPDLSIEEVHDGYHCSLEISDCVGDVFLSREATDDPKQYTVYVMRSELTPAEINVIRAREASPSTPGNGSSPGRQSSVRMPKRFLSSEGYAMRRPEHSFKRQRLSYDTYQPLADRGRALPAMDASARSISALASQVNRTATPIGADDSDSSMLDPKSDHQDTSHHEFISAPQSPKPSSPGQGLLNSNLQMESERLPDLNLSSPDSGILFPQTVVTNGLNSGSASLQPAASNEAARPEESQVATPNVGKQATGDDSASIIPPPKKKGRPTKAEVAAREAAAAAVKSPEPKTGTASGGTEKVPVEKQRPEKKARRPKTQAQENKGDAKGLPEATSMLSEKVDTTDRQPSKAGSKGPKNTAKKTKEHVSPEQAEPANGELPREGEQESIEPPADDASRKKTPKRKKDESDQKKNEAGKKKQGKDKTSAKKAPIAGAEQQDAESTSKILPPDNENRQDKAPLPPEDSHNGDNHNSEPVASNNNENSKLSKAAKANKDGHAEDVGAEQKADPVAQKPKSSELKKARKLQMEFVNDMLKKPEADIREDAQGAAKELRAFVENDTWHPGKPGPTPKDVRVVIETLERLYGRDAAAPEPSATVERKTLQPPAREKSRSKSPAKAKVLTVSTKGGKSPPSSQQVQKADDTAQNHVDGDSLVEVGPNADQTDASALPQKTKGDTSRAKKSIAEKAKTLKSQDASQMGTALEQALKIPPRKLLDGTDSSSDDSDSDSDTKSKSSNDDLDQTPNGDGLTGKSLQLHSTQKPDAPAESDSNESAEGGDNDTAASDTTSDTTSDASESDSDESTPKPKSKPRLSSPKGKSTSSQASSIGSEASQQLQSEAAQAAKQTPARKVNGLLAPPSSKTKKLTPTMARTPTFREIKNRATQPPYKNPLKPTTKSPPTMLPATASSDSDTTTTDGSDDSDNSLVAAKADVAKSRIAGLQTLISSQDR